MDGQYQAARTYVAAHCIPEAELAARAGLNPAQLMALEAAGVEFIPADDEKGPGLRLKHKARGRRRTWMSGKSA